MRGVRRKRDPYPAGRPSPRHYRHLRANTGGLRPLTTAHERPVGEEITRDHPEITGYLDAGFASRSRYEALAGSASNAAAMRSVNGPSLPLGNASRAVGVVTASVVPVSG
jgi:hypothetical protein